MDRNGSAPGDRQSALHTRHAAPGIPPEFLYVSGRCTTTQVRDDARPMPIDAPPVRSTPPRCRIHPAIRPVQGTVYASDGGLSERAFLATSAPPVGFVGHSLSRSHAKEHERRLSESRRR